MEKWKQLIEERLKELEKIKAKAIEKNRNDLVRDINEVIMINHRLLGILNGSKKNNM